MKNHFIDINIEYDVDALIAMYDEDAVSASGPFVAAVLEGDLTVYEAVSELFDTFKFTLNNKNCSLTTIRRAVAMHTNPGNNGLIIFPLTGDLQVEFYSAEPPIVDGLPMLSPYLNTRPAISEEDMNTMLNSKFESKIIKTPIAINGRKLYSYKPVNNTIPMVFLLKIPFGVEWDQVQTVIKDLHA